MHKGEMRRPRQRQREKGMKRGGGGDGMRKITGHRRICRFGANTNDTESPPHAHVYITFCSNKICFRTTNGKQTDTQAGKHVHTKYQFGIIGANSSKLFRQKNLPECKERTYEA